MGSGSLGSGAPGLKRERKRRENAYRALERGQSGASPQAFHLRRRTSRETIKKICLLGDGRPQKAKLIKRYLYPMSDDNHIATIGTKVTKKSITYDKVIGGAPWDVRLALLNGDILGQLQYGRLQPVFYQAPEGALVVCDGADPHGAAALDDWATGFTEVVGPMPMSFFLNPVTLAAPVAVDLGAVETLWARWNSPFMHVSPKGGKTSSAHFSTLAESSSAGAS